MGAGASAWERSVPWSSALRIQRAHCLGQRTSTEGGRQRGVRVIGASIHPISKCHQQESRGTPGWQGNGHARDESQAGSGDRANEPVWLDKGLLGGRGGIVQEEGGEKWKQNLKYLHQEV